MYYKFTLALDQANYKKGFALYCVLYSYNFACIVYCQIDT